MLSTSIHNISVVMADILVIRLVYLQVFLLSTNDAHLLQCVLVALIHVSKTLQYAQLIGELRCIETLLRLLQDYELPFKGLVSTLLQSLSVDEGNRLEIKMYHHAMLPSCSCRLYGLRHIT